MANTKNYLEQIKLEGELRDLLFKAANVEVTYNGETMSLAAALTAIYGSLSAVPTTQIMNAAIASAISASGHARFVQVSAVPAVEDAKENVLYLVMNAKTKHYDIYAKVAGEAEGSFTVELLDDTTVDLTEKMDKVTGATAGDFATLDADGNVQDSGKKVGGAALSETPDADTLATEKAVAAALAGKAEKTSATTEAAGLMSPADKTRLDGIRGVRYGATVPDNMQDGELFIRVVSAEPGV